LWLVLAVCAAPIVASYAAYYFWQPRDHVNYGALIEPRKLPDAALTRLDARRFSLRELEGQWVLLAAAPAACDGKCIEKLVYMRQVRLAQGKETERVERVWLLTDTGTPGATLLAQHPGLVVVRDSGAVASALPAPNSPLEHVYVVDPLGNLMMRFPADPDPRRMLKDLSRLLRHSKWK
jgi:hypothetical protein